MGRPAAGKELLKNMNLESLRKNRFGFYELAEKPSAEELSRYYAQKYYQDSCSTYQKVYPEEELRYVRNKLEQKYAILGTLLEASQAGLPAFLDVGAGEGWALSFFKKKGWQCTGLDYSNFGCQTHNPASLADLVVGDIYENLTALLGEKRSFDVLLLDNVLEHVLDPLDLLVKLRGLVRPAGVLIIEVPNDCSVLQQHLLEHGHITRPFWIAVPDHISYFNREGLQAVCRAAGWEKRDLLGDFPIDLNLINPATNYVENRSAGKACHQTRISVENLLHEISPRKTNDLYRVLAELGLGRQIIGFFQEKVE